MFKKLLIANRGEIAVRVARTAAELGIATVAVYSDDDAASGHIAAADAAQKLDGKGAAAYLNMDVIIAVAQNHGCEAIHPGYGFLSENGTFARKCAEAGLIFVGPRPDIIALYGNKSHARALAADCGIPILSGTSGPTSIDEAQAYFASLPPGAAMMIKAIAGGGGRGMRMVTNRDHLAEAYARCRSEAKRSFGDDAVYVEQFVPRARHIEIQIAGDGRDVVHLWERECTLQRQNQKLIEIAPSPSLQSALRQRLCDAACRMAATSAYDNLGTFEFLVDLERTQGEETFSFIEANPRIQVEHTITEEITGLDLIRLQLDLASGRRLKELGLHQNAIAPPKGHAIQLRINMEAMDTRGRPRPSTGTVTGFHSPGGPGVRIDTFAYPGYATVSSFDSLLAKLVIWSAGDYAAAVARARRALREFRVEGLITNLPFLRVLLERPDVAENIVYTRFIEDHIAELLAAMPPAAVERRYNEDNALAGMPVKAPTQGIVTSLKVALGEHVRRGTEVAVIEAMKMEHAVLAECSGEIRALLIEPGAEIAEGAPILVIEPVADSADAAGSAEEIDLTLVRPDLAELRNRLAQTRNDRRIAAVENRRARGQRMARTNIADLCDPDSFIEYGGLAVAFQYARRSVEELRAKSPADGLITGLATANKDHVGAERAGIAIAAYDATVFAGTQGHINHLKLDRLFEVAGKRRLPFVLFAEGGGGRPGDDQVVVAGLQTPTFTNMARLSGRVPLIGIVSGRCFAGNAALLGLADVIIATENSTIGMGGPALVEAGGLGTFKPEEIGPIGVHSINGVVDIRVTDEAAAVAAARRYLSYFQGPVSAWDVADQRRLRAVVPENRLRAYDIHKAIDLLADTGSVLELRPAFGRSMLTALIRIAGRPMGLIANNPLHSAGAIESDGADKAARFMKLCNAFNLPLLTVIDTPEIMVGPEAEKTGLVRHAARLFLASANLRSPLFAVILRKAYGLGAQAMAGGHFNQPVFTIAWPTGEIGGMGLEGAVRLGFKREMEAIADPQERKAWYDARVADLYDNGKALNIAQRFELDAVIDPAETRDWIIAGLQRTTLPETAGSGSTIDAW